jgi:outer membrane protein OmpA-like peptidoglycan-associated protein/tetratricopeptide (TPR) repeat protein
MIKKILMKKYFLLWIALFGLFSVHSQTKLVDKAEKEYDKQAYAYVSSSDLYDKLVQKEFGSSGIYAKLGDSYYFNGDYKNALKSYNQIGKLKDNYKFTDEQLFRYAQCLKSDGKFDEASKIIKELNSKSGKEAINSGTDYLKEVERQSNRYTIKPVSINSKMPDYGATFYKENQVVFTSARDTNVVERMKDRWNKKPFFKLYEATITDDGDLADAKRINGKVNSVFHQSTPAFTKDGTQMYFTRSNFLGNKYGVDDTKTNRLRIYRATLVNDKWTNIEDLSFNNESFSNAHPALRPDGKSLVFASDRPGSVGQTDLYEVAINTDGTFGEVKTLGPSINTIGRETFPTISTTGEFYFASDGHSGLGGLDVFEAVKNSDNTTYRVVNVGKPINSPGDDFGLIINAQTRKGFFASNRTGDDQIYSFVELEPLKLKYDLVVFGKVYDKKYNELLPKTKISLFDSNQKKLDDYYTDNAGEYLIKVPAGDYYLTYDKVGYLQGKEDLKIIKKDENQMIEINKYLDTDPNASELTTEDNKSITDGSDLTKKLGLKPIYFDFDDTRIKPVSEKELNKIVQVLKDYPTITVDIRSHTDSRGDNEYNLKLSERRAKATVDYLLNKGARPSRVTGKGYGETQLINKCSDGVKCTDKEHQLNRRSEFIINFNNK